MATRGRKPKAKTEHLVPFPAHHLPVDPEKMEVVPDIPRPPLTAYAEIECKVTSVGTRYWSGMVFVALEAIDGQNLLSFLRKDQVVKLVHKAEGGVCGTVAELGHEDPIS
jgi:hypothetical protein